MLLLSIVMPADVFTRFVQASKVLFDVTMVTAKELKGLSRDDSILRMSHLSVDISRRIQEIWESPEQLQEDTQILLAAGKKAAEEKSR